MPESLHLNKSADGEILRRRHKENERKTGNNKQEVTTHMKKIRQLHSRGKKVVFPDIDRLEQIMLAEVKDNAAE